MPRFVIGADVAGEFIQIIPARGVTLGDRRAADEVLSAMQEDGRWTTAEVRELP